MHWSCPTRRVCGKGIPMSAWCEQLVLGSCPPGAEPLLLAAWKSWDSVVWLGSLDFAGEEETTGATLLCFHSIATIYSTREVCTAGKEAGLVQGPCSRAWFCCAVSLAAS